jgi:ClpP class serine protease
MTRALTAITSQPWAITHEWLDLLAQVARRETDVHALEAQLGAPLRNTRTVTVRDGVALIPVAGPIFRRANLFSQISGATSIDVLARDVAAALASPEVRAIVLDIDSPGGAVSGIHELAEQIYAARAQKSITAYIGGMGCSAAYWLAAACTEVVADATAMVGNIGIIMATMSGREPGELEFTGRNATRKNADVATSAGRADIQAVIDATYDVFVADVARFRGVSVATVEADYGAGGIFVGNAAVRAGLIDRVDGLEPLLTTLRPASRTLRPPLVAHTPVATPQGDIHPSHHQRSTVMDEPTPAAQTPPGAVPVPPTVDDPAAQAQIAAYARQMQEQLRSQHQAYMEQAQQQARAEFERWKAEQARSQAIMSFAQHITTPTLERPHAVAYTADQIVGLLSGLTDDKRQAVEQVLRDAVDGALTVAFNRIGATGASTTPDEAAQWRDLVAQHEGRGLGRTAAIQAAMHANPALYRAQSAPKGGA